MDADEYSVAQRKQAAVTPNECYAMRLLRLDGYNISELELMFNVDENTALRHTNANCKVHALPGSIHDE